MATMALTDGPRKRVRKSRAIAEYSAESEAMATLGMTVPLGQGTMMSPAGPPVTGWRYVVRNMQAIVITLVVCITAIVCVWIASSRAPATAAPRFQTIDFDDEDGKTLLKFDRESGRAWRLAKMRIPVRARKADGSAGPQLVAGWEEISPSFEQGVQDTWHRLGAPTPSP
ncbi:MAG: hypothetical protein ACR2MF_00660 [Chthoniobacterales bacterium]